MEIEKLCVIRDIYRSINDFGQTFAEKYRIGLNEAMAMCALTEGRLSSGDLAEKIGLTNSNTSKIIRTIEEKGFIDRMLGENDKRQMYFVLTPEGEKIINNIKYGPIEVPQLLESFIKSSINQEQHSV